MTPSFVSTSVRMNGQFLNSPILATMGRRSGAWITRTTTLSRVRRTGGVPFIFATLTKARVDGMAERFAMGLRGTPPSRPGEHGSRPRRHRGADRLDANDPVVVLAAA